MKPEYVLAIFIGVAAFSVYVALDMNGGSLDFSDRQLTLVVTNSMDGDITDYDVDSFPADTLVIIQHLPDNEVRLLRVGDVISYHDGSMLIHHRIVQVNSDSFYVRGDNGHSTDKVMFDEVNGLVVGTNPLLGHVVSWISSHFLVFVGTMLALCMLFFTLSMYLPQKNSKEAD